MNWVLSSERLVEEPHFSSTQTASFLEKAIPAILTADHLNEEPDIPEDESRFGRHGFRGWLFSADRLELEPVPGINEKPVSRSYDLMSIFSQEEIVEQPVGTQPLPATGIRNMRSWLLSADPLEEEYAAGKSSTRFGETGFTRWLFKSDPLQEEQAVLPSRGRLGGKPFIRWVFSSEKVDKETSDDI